MRRLLGISRTGLDALQLHPLRSLVTIAAVVAVLVPFLTCLAISRGIEAEAEASIRCGATLYVSGEEFGRSAPIPVAVAAPLEKLEGVTKVVPRIVGAITLGKEQEPAVVVGLPVEDFPTSVRCVAGRLPRVAAINEFVVGTELARRLKLRVGSRILPFYHSKQGERVSEVVGIFEADAPLWQARLILTPFQKAAAIFDAPDCATDLLVYCRPSYQEQIRDAIHRGPALGGIRARVTTRDDLAALLPRDLLHREGIFNLHFVLAFAVGILVVLVTSGIGLAERRREVGILKATGWQTDEVMLRGIVESVLLSVTAAATAIVVAWVWLSLLNGYGIAGLFLSGTGVAPNFTVPFHLTPTPALLVFVVSFAVIMSGTLYATWRAAITSPLEAMR